MSERQTEGQYFFQVFTNKDSCVKCTCTGFLYEFKAKTYPCIFTNWESVCLCMDGVMQVSSFHPRAVVWTPKFVSFGTFERI